MIASLKTLQILASLGLVALAWIVYPGPGLAFALGAGVAYFAAAVLAALDYRFGIWAAFLLSVLTALFTGYGVYRYVVNGFDFLSGRFGPQGGVRLAPYLFVAVAVAAAAAVLLHLLGGRRWMLEGRGSALR